MKSNLMKQLMVAFALVFFVASCASTGAASGTAKAKKQKAYDPSGTWEYVVETPDGASSGTLTIGGAAGTYTAAMETDQFGTLQLADVDLVDKTMTGSIEVMGMGADVEITFDEDTFDGAVYLGEDAFPIEGKRTSK